MAGASIKKKQLLSLWVSSVLLLILANHRLWTWLLKLDDSPYIRAFSIALYTAILLHLAYVSIRRKNLGELWRRDLGYQVLLLFAGLIVTLGSQRIKAGHFPEMRILPWVALLLLASRGLMVAARYHFPGKGWKSGFATSIWALLTIFLIVELAFSQVGETHGSVRTLANLTWHARHSKPLNSLGAPDFEHKPEDLNDPSKAKILYLGDSFTAGAGLDKFLEDRYSNRIRNLACPETPWIHVNLGWGGASQKEEQGILASFDYDYDAAVLSYLPNDIFPVAVAHGKAQELPQNEYEGLNFATQFLIDHSYCLNWAYWHMANRNQSDYVGTLSKLYEDETVFQAHLQELGDLVDALEGRPVIVIVFPILGDIPRQHAMLDRVSVFLESRCARLIRVDRFPDLLRSPNDFIVNKNDLHPNEALHALVADSISQAIYNSADLREAICKASSQGSSLPSK